MLQRAAARGFIVGGLVTAILLVLFPHFYGRFLELFMVPAAGVLAGLVLGLIVRAWRLIRKRPAIKRARFSRVLVAFIAIAVAAPLLLYVLRAPSRSWRTAPKLMVLCIDGGTWDIINPLIEAGWMPNIARLKREGVSGVLMSTDPSFSPIVWTTIATGVEPEKHGINSFYSTQDYLRHKRLWDVVEESGHSIGLFRWLVTWPPHATNGFIIPSILARDARCFPDKYNFINQLRSDKKSERSTGALEQVSTLWRFLRAGLRLETCLDIARDLWPAWRSGRGKDFHIAMRRTEIRLNTDVYCHLLREAQPEYTCFYDNGADVLCHFYWHYFEPERFVDVDSEAIERYGNAIPDYYTLNDKVFGQILDHLDPLTSVVVVSDHGHRANTEDMHLKFLPRLEPVLEALGMDTEYYGIALGSSLFIESVKTDSAENQALLERATEVFNSVTLQESGIHVLDAVISDERVLLKASDELTTLDGTILTSNGTSNVKDWFTTKAKSGTHEPEGIYLFEGEAFRAGVNGPKADLIDITPTLLYLSGFPLTREFDGEVVREVFTDDFTAKTDVVWVDSYGHFDATKRNLELDQKTVEKLRALGYIR